MKTSFKIIFILLFIFNINLIGQEVKIKEIVGEVSFLTTQNIYVKFDDASLLTEGDTIYIKRDGNLLPLLIVKFLSSTSAAGTPITETEVQTNEKVYAYVKEITPVKKEIVSQEITPDKTPKESSEIHVIKPVLVHETREKISGRFSVQSYTNLSNSDGVSDFQRWRYSLSFNAENISNSPLTFNSYIIFAYRADDWANVSSNIGRNLKIYDLAVDYKFNEKANIKLGRAINRKISNLGSVDGIQFEYGFGNFFSGLIAGSRPNFSDYGYNAKLFQFGGFFGRSDTTGSGTIENSLGVFQQTNNFKTDRRFLYFQHTNTAIEKTFFMLSTEFDLFKREMGVDKNTFAFTSLFLSARYAPDRIISFSLSYDARRNVIYYETFKSLIDSVIENHTRQGLRFRTNIRPLNNVMIGLSAGYRFLRSDLQPSKNFNASIAYSKIPLIDASSSVSYTYLQSSYLTGSVVGVRLSKYVTNPNIDFSLGYRNTFYEYSVNRFKLTENSFTADCSVSIIRPLFLTLSFEGTFQGKRTYSRVLIDLTARI